MRFLTAQPHDPEHLQQLPSANETTKLVPNSTLNSTSSFFNHSDNKALLAIACLAGMVGYLKLAATKPGNILVKKMVWPVAACGFVFNVVALSSFALKQQIDYTMSLQQGPEKSLEMIKTFSFILATMGMLLALPDKVKKFAQHSDRFVQHINDMNAKVNEYAHEAKQFVFNR